MKEAPLGTHENPSPPRTAGRCPNGHGFISKSATDCPTCGVSLEVEEAAEAEAETETATEDPSE